MIEEKQLGMTTPPHGTWIQMDRESLLKLAKLSVEHPRAAALLNVIVSLLGRHNAVVASQQTLAKLAGVSLATAKRALETLAARSWIETKQIGLSGTVNAYIVNDRVAWSGTRDGKRYSMFSATIIAADDEQPGGCIGEPKTLNKIAAPSAGEHQQLDLEDKIRELEGGR